MIRPARDEDLEQVASLVRLLDHHAIVAPDSLRHRLPDAFVAEVEGEVIGWAPAATGWIFIGVHPSCRRQGIGGGLLEQLGERRRGERVIAIALDEEGERFLEQRGFEPAGTLRTAVLEVQAAVLPQSPEAPFTVVRLADVRHRVEELYALYMDTLSDVPNAEGFLAQTLDEWRAHVLDNPRLDDRISVVVLDEDRPVALAWLVSDGSRAAADYAGTARSHRGTRARDAREDRLDPVRAGGRDRDDRDRERRREPRDAPHQRPPGLPARARAPAVLPGAVATRP